MRSYSSTFVVLVGACAAVAAVAPGHARGDSGVAEAAVRPAGRVRGFNQVGEFGALEPGQPRPRIRQAVRSQRPWKARRPPTPPASSHQLLDVDRWPDEPQSPDVVDAEQFRVAVAHLCNKALTAVPSDEVLQASSAAGVDPFLLAALMLDRSRCDRRRRGKRGIGLLGLQPALYQNAKAPGPKIAASEWRPGKLRSVNGNLGLGARLLRMWQEQHETLDLAFGGVAHRSAVSHFVWGDVVGSSGNEDLILTARRRLIARYHGTAVTPAPSEDLGVALVPPLESVPRVATSGPGDDREGGIRRHRGLDLVATVGEPVRAIADGTVIFAGANLASNPRKGSIPPRKISRYARQPMGVGGIYLCVRHTVAAPAGTHTSKPSRALVSCYMHLSRYFVAQGSAVKAGDVIAIVGRTGVKRSPPHLHFEMRLDGVPKDPWRYFSDTIIPPRDTLTYRFNARNKRARLRAARLAQMVRIPKS